MDADKELAAMRKILKALEPFDATTQARILDFVIDRTSLRRHIETGDPV
jgi:hypothetical protein